MTTATAPVVQPSTVSAAHGFCPPAIPTGGGLTIAARYAGPPGMANGGYVSGLFVEKLGGTVEVTLRAPTPLQTRLHFRPGEAGELSLCGPDARVLATGRRASLSAPAPSGIDFERATAAARHFAGHVQHPFPQCFVCGSARDRHDGLCIFSGRPDAATRGPVYAPWVPGGAVAAPGSDVVAPRFVAAALDCAGAWAAFEGVPRPMVLGRTTLRVEHLPRVGERCVSVGLARGRERRKHFTGTALHGDDGRLLGHSEQTWIALR